MLFEFDDLDYVLISTIIISKWKCTRELRVLAINFTLKFLKKPLSAKKIIKLY